MLTCADYAYNPWDYDPARSIGQAIYHLAETKEQRELMRDLVEAYPGMLIYGKPQTGLNAVREQYQRIVSAPHSRYIARNFINYLENLAARMDKIFPDIYKPEKKTLRDDIKVLKEMYKGKYKDMTP